MSKYPLVLIEWLDSHSQRGWQDVADIAANCEPLHCRSVGWLVSEKNGHKTIVPHLSGEKNGNIVVNGRGDLTIPKQCIIKMTVIRKGE